MSFPRKNRLHAAVVESIEPRLLMAVDNVDTTFGVNGYGIAPGTQLEIRDAALQSDDKIVEAATFTSASGKPLFAAVRWTANGVLDTTFSSDGIATADLFPAGDSRDGSDATHVALQSEGKVIVAGTVFDSITTSGIVSYTFKLGLARFNTNGTLDTTFDTDGMSTLAFPNQVTALQVNALTGGEIAIFGNYAPSEGVSGHFIAHFNANGSPDTTYGGGEGWLALPTLPAGQDWLASKILPDGKVVVISGVSGALHVLRFTANGTADSSFAGDGSGDYFTDRWYGGSALAIDADGKLVISGSQLVNGNGFGALTRINIDGTVDTSFGVDGLVSGRRGSFQDVSIASNGDISVGGGNAVSVLYRYTSDGSPYFAYTTGVVAGDPDHFAFFHIATQSTGKVILAGSWFPDPNANPSNLAVARLTDNPAPFDDGPQGAIQVLGTSGADVITISTANSTITVDVNGQQTTYPTQGYTAANITALAGNDQITVTSDLDITADCGDGNDTIVTGAGNDSITGGAGNDSILTGAGNDSSAGGLGDDIMDGGDGNDRVLGDAGDDTCDGGAGLDLVGGDIGNDELHGGDGDDVLQGGPGNDFVDAGNGNDLANGQEGHDVMLGGDGNDQLYGMEGADSLYGGAGKDRIDGGSQSDLLSGGGGKDKIAGSGGHDRIHGGDNDDQLDGGAGDDRIYGDNGNDKLFAGPGANHLDGGDGDDFALGDRDFDQLLNTEAGT